MWCGCKQKFAQRTRFTFAGQFLILDFGIIVAENPLNYVRSSDMKNYIEFQSKKGTQKIGAGYPAFIIAEAGSNHDQKIEQALQLIDVAAESQADAVKFQLFTAEGLVGESSPHFAAVKKAEMPRKWIHQLVEHCEKRNILFMATPFDREAMDLLCEINSPIIKWASSETTNLPLLAYAATKQKAMVISTGMCDLADVQQAVTVMHECGNSNLSLLQCVSNYPTEPKDANLRVMDTLAQAFQCPVGFSDHSLGIALPLAAVARGATVIEKHFTLSRKLEGPDHSYAIEPHELKLMVQSIREVEASLGSPVKSLHALEIQYGRRDGFYAARDLKKGDRISESDVKIARPSHGIRQKYDSLVMGAVLKEPVAKDAPIQWKHLGWM